jgi:hypothetical protein
MNDDIFNVNSFNQQGGITAGQVNFGLLPRHLDDSLQSQLLGVLKKDDEITITSVMGDQEALIFANEIKIYLGELGYVVKGVNQAIYNNPVIGQHFNRKPNSNQVDIIIGGNQRK